METNAGNTACQENNGAGVMEHPNVIHVDCDRHPADCCPHFAIFDQQLAIVLASVAGIKENDNAEGEGAREELHGAPSIIPLV